MIRPSWILATGLLCAAVSGIAQGADEAAATVTTLLSTTHTATGQPITLPQGDVRVVVSQYVIKVGARLPLHEHPYARYAYVLDGELDVVNTDTGTKARYKPGDVLIEAIGQWHYGEAIGTTPVRLLVIDQIPASATTNTLMKQ